MNNYKELIGTEITVTIDRPLGNRHPKYPATVYPVNYGYVEGILGGNGEEQDVYLLGLCYPVTDFRAVIIAVIKRFDDTEDKWVAAPPGKTFSAEDIRRLTYFQEQYFRSEIICQAEHSSLE